LDRISEKILLHVNVDYIGGEPVLKAILETLSQIGKIVSVSNVYKRYTSVPSLDSRANLELVAKLITRMEINDVLNMIRAIREMPPKSLSHPVELTILTFGDKVWMSPELTLPYPTLHSDGLILMCACEVDADFVHPILKKSLREMVVPQAETVSEFYLQGGRLVTSLSSP
jgi:7,8-dihydro-6-hydroxymethylpterin-pyrophosphokinase